MKIYLVMKLWDNSKVDTTKKTTNSKYKPPEIMRAYIRKTSAEQYLQSLRRERAKKRIIRNYTFELEPINVHDYKPPADFYERRKHYGDTNYSPIEAESL